MVFEVFISAKCVYRMYLTYFLFNLSNKRILSFLNFWDFLPILQISWNFGIFWPKKINPIFKNPTVDSAFGLKFWHVWFSQNMENVCQMKEETECIYLTYTFLRFVKTIHAKI